MCLLYVIFPHKLYGTNHISKSIPGYDKAVPSLNEEPGIYWPGYLYKYLVNDFLFEKR